MINWSRKCIFARVPKTASSSLMHAIYGKIEFHKKTGKISGKYKRWAGIKHPKGWSQIKWIKNPGRFDLNHVPLPFIKESVDPDKYINFYKFGFVRNPWDRVYAQYRYSFDWMVQDNIYHKIMKWNPPSFEEFCNKLDDPETIWFTKTKWTQAFFCQGADFIGKFETLAEDYESLIASHRGFKKSAKKMPHVNAHIGVKTPWWKMYNSTTSKLVEKKYEEDIDKFKYLGPFHDSVQE